MSGLKKTLLNRVAVEIKKAAVRGAGRASEVGVYQPKRPEQLKK